MTDDVDSWIGGIPTKQSASEYFTSNFPKRAAIINCLLDCWVHLGFESLTDGPYALGAGIFSPALPSTRVCPISVNAGVLPLLSVNLKGSPNIQ